MKKLKEIVLAGIAALGISACCNAPEHSISMQRDADGYRSEEEQQEINQGWLSQPATYETVKPLIGFLNDFSVHLLNVTGRSWIAEEFAYSLGRARLTITETMEEYRSLDPYLLPNGRLSPEFFRGCCDAIVLRPQLSIFSQIHGLPHELGHAMDEYNGRPTSDNERFSTAMELYAEFRFFAYDQILGSQLIMRWGQAPFAELPNDIYGIHDIHAAYHFAVGESWEAAMEAIAYEPASERREHLWQIKQYFSRDMYRAIASAIVDNPAFENALSQEGLAREEIDWIREYLHGTISFVSTENTGTFCNPIEAEVDWQIPFAEFRQNFQQIHCQ